jgi:hypothetical protein
MAMDKNHPRSWILEGLRDGNSWVILNKQEQNKDLGSGTPWQPLLSQRLRLSASFGFAKQVPITRGITAWQ